MDRSRARFRTLLLKKHPWPRWLGRAPARMAMLQLCQTYYSTSRSWWKSQPHRTTIAGSHQSHIIAYLTQCVLQEGTWPQARHDDSRNCTAATRLPEWSQKVETGSHAWGRMCTKLAYAGWESGKSIITGPMAALQGQSTKRLLLWRGLVNTIRGDGLLETHTTAPLSDMRVCWGMNSSRRGQSNAILFEPDSGNEWVLAYDRDQPESCGVCYKSASVHEPWAGYPSTLKIDLERVLWLS